MMRHKGKIEESSKQNRNRKRVTTTRISKVKHQNNNKTFDDIFETETKQERNTQKKLETQNHLMQKSYRKQHEPRTMTTTFWCLVPIKAISHIHQI